MRGLSGLSRLAHGVQDVEHMQAAGERHGVVQQMVVAQEDRPFAAVTAIPATQGQRESISNRSFAANHLRWAACRRGRHSRAPRRHWQGSAPANCLVLSKQS